jgi:hypothetical protein
MSFRRGDIRHGMDVFTLDGAWLGTVRRIDAAGDAEDMPELSAAVRQSSAVSGESLGPVPTQRYGNRGPERQSAREDYAIKPALSPPLGSGTITFGKYHALVGRRTVSLDDVQNVALERVILRYTEDELEGK